MKVAAHPHPPTTLPFWRAYWVTLRPYLFFVSGAAGLVGLALVPDLPPAALAAAATAFFFAYGLGQALTDVTQTDTDAISSPYRPLVRGAIRRRDVVGISLLGMALCTLTFATMNPWTLPVCALAVVGLATYTPLKRRWWGGPAWNSWIVACLPLIGFLCGGSTPREALGDGALPAAMLSVFCSYAVFVILGYFKDVEADRATGYDTLPVRFGRRISTLVSAVLCVAAAAASAYFLTARGALNDMASVPTAAGLLLWATGLVLLGFAHVRILPTAHDTEAHPAIALSVHGFVAMHLGAAALLRPELSGACVAVFVASTYLLRRRPCREQV